MSPRVPVFRYAVAVAVLAAARVALAQHVGYDLERLWLDPSARGSLVIGSGETLPAGAVRFSVAGGWEKSPLVITEDGLRGRGLLSEGDKIDDVVENRWTLHLGGAVGLTRRLELGARLPMTVSQDGPSDSLRKTLVGTASAMLRLGMTRQDEGAPVSSAIAVEGAFPITQSGDIDGDPTAFFVPRLEVGHRFERVLLAGNVGGIIRPDALKLTGHEKLGHEITAGAALATVGRPLRWELSARGAFNMDGLGAHAEVLGGVRWGFRWAELFALAGPGFFESPGTPTFRAVVGLALFTPEREERKAEPPPPVKVDACAPGMPHTPEQCPDLDDDGDGVPNGQDRCPLVKGLPELQGCPAKDTDGDGVPDHLDKCPTVKGLPEYQGCPPPDRDGDGIPDAEDKCPDQPGLPELKGCPPARAEIKAGKIDIREKVFFDTGKATVQQRSHALLDDVAKLLNANPQVGKIRIEGHTDNRGAVAVNRRLSQARAEAVRAYLISRGVDANRLEAQGLGPDRPAQTNKTAVGREANRRVEFAIIGANP